MGLVLSNEYEEKMMHATSGWKHVKFPPSSTATTDFPDGGALIGLGPSHADLGSWATDMPYENERNICFIFVTEVWGIFVSTD